MSTDRSQPVQSSTESSTDQESTESQNLAPENETLSNIEELHDRQRVYSQTSNIGQATDDASSASTSNISGGPVPVIMIASRSEEINVEKTSQLSTTHVAQESERNINLTIRATGVVTSSVKIKVVQRTREKRVSMEHPLEPPIEREISKELDLLIGSTGFSEESITIDVKDLCDAHKISCGEFGDVFSVVSKTSDAIPIAVKRIPHCKVKISEVKIMLEVCTGACLYIVDYYRALVENDNKNLYICMEFMDASIDAFYKTMHKQYKLECDNLEQLVHRITHDVASGLNYMATKHIMHRDIKPANLLINKEAYVKLCDFGIARSFAQMDLYFNDLNDADFCSLSPLLHTENYMPPRIKGCIQDDMWSLGITLLEVVSGRNPFADWNSGGRHSKLMNWEPSIPPVICNNMHQLILHLLEKDPHKRPGSYEDILNAPPICDVSNPPSTDECTFVRSMIEKIS